MSTTARGTDRVWFITGASRGLGRAFAEAALAAGDRVAAAARTTGPLEELAAAHPGRVLALGVDVTDRDAVFAAVTEAVGHFGRLDVVVNNAGALSMGMVEEFTEAEARALMDLNFFGALWVSQAVLPTLRAQGSGHLVQISSIGALGGFPSSGLYSASKFALEGLSESLAMEVADFGIKVSIVQPGGYWTDLYTRMGSTEPQEAYAPLRAELEKQFAEGSVDSDPRLAAQALLKLVDSERPPLRLLLGSMVYDLAFDLTRTRMDTWAAWEDVSRAAEQAIAAPGTTAGEPTA
ncbi:putative oxidoreductase [Streptomyces sp. YIM 121038]|uniref:SDR family NAD(P)-dependent oxidoreductase n=1 Tax=Streptomyces sp. YIM 121038 TaxID=2136401 RepID=UPI0011105E82|nr:SDR family NAD(P)-dependent oxidoreductase [Streptomyces sp. YIM 121038]QCX80669.1 putative oxidoreductase [Streptomyces sp. YIM 121038]